MNVKKILVAVDYSDSSDAAMIYAATLAREFDAEIHLVHIYDPPYTNIDAGFSGSIIPEEIPPVDMEAEKARLDLVSPGKGTRFLHAFVVGFPVEELVRYAKEQNVDLVVMGTHGRTGLTRLLMGGVAEGVVRSSPCPVLTIKQPAVTLQESA